MKSRSRLGALWNGHGEQLASRMGLQGWEYKLQNLTVSLVYVNNKGVVIIPLFEYISVCYVKLLERAEGVEVYDL